MLDSAGSGGIVVGSVEPFSWMEGGALLDMADGAPKHDSSWRKKLKGSGPEGRRD